MKTSRMALAVAVTIAFAGTEAATRSAFAKPSAVQSCDTPSPKPSMRPPLHTDGRWIVRRYNDTAHLPMGFTTEPEPLI